DYAHRHGVVHRDIKPENILLHDGRPIVADFGIALALSAAAGGRMTETGMSLGTPHYMSPEQATADKELTGRSDIYSLASVLFEMLTGEPPHMGKSAQQIIMKIIAEPVPSVTSLRKSVPENIAAAVGKALEKLPADRFATAKEFAEALANPGFVVAQTQGGISRSTASDLRTWWRDWRPWALAAGLGALGIVAGRLAFAAPDRSAAVARFQVLLAPEHGITGAPVNTLALGPDGRTIVYVGRSGATAGFQLLERRIDELGDFRPIPGTQGGSFPAFSPDGRKLAYVASGRIQVLSVPFAGGAPTAVTQVPPLAIVVWLDDHTVATNNDSGGIDKIGIDGTVTHVASPDRAHGERNLWVMAALPSGRQVLVVPSAGTNTTGPVVAVDMRTGRRTEVLRTDVTGVWYADGCLLWSQPSGALQGAPFDAGRVRLTGAAVTLAENVRQAIGGSGQVATSGVGSLVYLPAAPPDLVLVDRAGHREVLDSGQRFHSPRFSPDGRDLALDFTAQDSRDVHIFNLRERTLRRLSFENDGHDPVWSADGRWIYYVHLTGIWRRRADGGGAVDSVSADAGSALEGERDGSIITASGVGGSGNGSFDIGVLSADSPRVATVLLGTPFSEEAATVSRDGRCLAYASDETGRSEVYVRPYPKGGAKVLVSRGGGSEPRWGPDGRTLYYDGQQNGVPYLVAASVAPGADFTVKARTPLFDVSEYEPAEPHANWDVAPDGSRFAMVYQGALSEMVFILNWPGEVRRQDAGTAR
ncbi:MAG: protein kinase domain-containing protein, partial [Gemmatimonadales bacterium]